jgi:hypothetical protein
VPPASSFDPTGRATPDAAVLGEGNQVIIDGEVTVQGGTSASAPVFAVVVSLLNQARLAQGSKQMGFLNPFLYANADAFTSDRTSLFATTTNMWTTTTYPLLYRCRTASTARRGGGTCLLPNPTLVPGGFWGD